MYTHTHTHTNTHTYIYIYKYIYPTSFIEVSVGVYGTILLYWDSISEEMDASVINFIKEDWSFATKV